MFNILVLCASVLTFAQNGKYSSEWFGLQHFGYKPKYHKDFKTEQMVITVYLEGDINVCIKTLHFKLMFFDFYSLLNWFQSWLCVVILGNNRLSKIQTTGVVLEKLKSVSSQNVTEWVHITTWVIYLRKKNPFIWGSLSNFHLQRNTTLNKCTCFRCRDFCSTQSSATVSFWLTSCPLTAWSHSSWTRCYPMWIWVRWECDREQRDGFYLNRRACHMVQMFGEADLGLYWNIFVQRWNLTQN